VRFTWDPRKSETNLADRGFDFEFATLIFDGPTLEREASAPTTVNGGSSPWESPTVCT
jgi:uncharacterized DUF497 family protein